MRRAGRGVDSGKGFSPSQAPLPRCTARCRADGVDSRWAPPFPQQAVTGVRARLGAWRRALPAPLRAPPSPPIAPPPSPRPPCPASRAPTLGPCVGRCLPGAAWGVRSRGTRGAAAADMRGSAETPFCTSHIIFAHLTFLHSPQAPDSIFFVFFCVFCVCSLLKTNTVKPHRTSRDGRTAVRAHSPPRAQYQ